MARFIRGRQTQGFRNLRQILRDMDKKKLSVGWFESARYDADTPVAAVAATQEFGSAEMRIPPRPFMRPTIEDKRQDWVDTLTVAMTRVVNDQATTTQALDILGLRLAGQIRLKISQIHEPPLSPVTLALRKQKRQGTVITRSLVRATAAAVRRGDTGPGELGDSSGINPKPLVFDGILLGTLTHVVEES